MAVIKGAPRTTRGQPKVSRKQKQQGVSTNRLNQFLPPSPFDIFTADTASAPPVHTGNRPPGGPTGPVSVPPQPELTPEQKTEGIRAYNVAMAEGEKAGMVHAFDQWPIGGTMTSVSGGGPSSAEMTTTTTSVTVGPPQTEGEDYFSASTAPSESGGTTAGAVEPSESGGTTAGAVGPGESGGAAAAGGGLSDEGEPTPTPPTQEDTIRSSIQGHISRLESFVERYGTGFSLEAIRSGEFSPDALLALASAADSYMRLQGAKLSLGGLVGEGKISPQAAAELDSQIGEALRRYSWLGNFADPDTIGFLRETAFKQAQPEPAPTLSAEQVQGLLETGYRYYDKVVSAYNEYKVTGEIRNPSEVLQALAVLGSYQAYVGNEDYPGLARAAAQFVTLYNEVSPILAEVLGSAPEEEEDVLEPTASEQDIIRWRQRAKWALEMLKHPDKWTREVVLKISEIVSSLPPTVVLENGEWKFTDADDALLATQLQNMWKLNEERLGEVFRQETGSVAASDEEVSKWDNAFNSTLNAIRSLDIGTADPDQVLDLISKARVPPPGVVVDSSGAPVGTLTEAQRRAYAEWSAMQRVLDTWEGIVNARVSIQQRVLAEQQAAEQLYNQGRIDAEAGRDTYAANFWLAQQHERQAEQLQMAATMLQTIGAFVRTPEGIRFLNNNPQILEQFTNLTGIEITIPTPASEDEVRAMLTQREALFWTWPSWKQRQWLDEIATKSGWSTGDILSLLQQMRSEREAAARGVSFAGVGSTPAGVAAPAITSPSPVFTRTV